MVISVFSMAELIRATAAVCVCVCDADLQSPICQDEKEIEV